MKGKGGDNLEQAYQTSRLLEGFDGLLFTDIGFGVRILPQHIKQARLTLRPDDPFYDEHNADVLTPFKYEVGGLHIDVLPTALSKGLREWNWDTVPAKSCMGTNGALIITVGAETGPPSRL